MPAIPVIQQQTRASMAGLGAGPTGGNGLEALAAGLHDVEQADFEAQVAEVQLQERNAAAEANAEVMSARTQWIQELQNRQQAAPPGAGGFTPQVLADFDKDTAERLKKAKTAASRKYLEQRLGDVRLSVFQDALQFETVAGAKHREGLLQQSHDQARTVAEFRPEDFDKLLEEQSIGINAAGVAPQRAEELRGLAKAGLAEAAVMGLIRRNPRSTLKELNNEKSKISSINALGFEDRERLRNAAESEVRRLDAEARSSVIEAKQAMTDRFQDMQVAAQRGLPIDVPPRQVLVALYGEQEGARRHQTAQSLAALSHDVAGLQQLSTAELFAKVQSYAPTQVDGAREKDQMQAALASSVSQIIQQRAKDPAGYLVQQSPAARKAWEDMSADPTKAPQYIAAVRAEKERLGIPGEAVLPDSYVAQLADDVAGTNAAGVADRLDEEARRWGDAWPQVYGQLAAKLPPLAAVIGSGIPKSAATALAATASMKESELKAMLPPSTKWADLQSAVDGQFDEFVRTMPPEAAATTAATKEAAVRLTLKYMNAGAGRGDAVRRAYRDLVGSQYEVRSIRGAAVRIPAGSNVDAIETGAQKRLQEFVPDARSLVIPPGASLSAEEYAARYATYVRDNGYWVTSPSGKGLRLYVDGAPVVTSGGAVEVPWNDLANAGMQSMSGTAAAGTRRPAPN